MVEDDLLAPLQIPSVLSKTHASVVGVGLGVISKPMSLSHNAFEEMRCLLDAIPYHKENCFCLKPPKRIEHGGRDIGMRTIIERDKHATARLPRQPHPAQGWRDQGLNDLFEVVNHRVLPAFDVPGALPLCFRSFS